MTKTPKPPAFRRVASQFFLVSPDSQVAGDLADPLACLRRGAVLNEKRRKQVQQNYFEEPFCLSCTFIFRNERNWMKKSARVSEKLVSPCLPGLQVATCLALVFTFSLLFVHELDTTQHYTTQETTQ